MNRTGGPKRTTRLRQRSKRTADVYADERGPLVERLLRTRRTCELRVECGGDPAVDVHEIMRRSRSGSIVDETNCLTACRRCHTWVTEHDRAAACLGLSLPSWAAEATDDPWEEAAHLRQRDGSPCPWRDATRACPSPDGVQVCRCAPL